MEATHFNRDSGLNVTRDNGRRDLCWGGGGRRTACLTGMITVHVNTHTHLGGNKLRPHHNPRASEAFGSGPPLTDEPARADYLR